jgi:chromosome segregation ATPase
MPDDFKISQAMTKKELMEEHAKLFAAYREKAREADAARKERETAQEELAAISSAKEATVDGVITSIGELRSQTGRTMSGLLETMTALAERLQQLNRAVDDREARIQELEHVHSAAVTLANVVETYDDRKSAADQEFAEQLATLEARFDARRSELEREMTEARASLEAEISNTRRQWDEERAQREKEIADASEKLARDRRREEEEYVYERDRQRRLEEDKWTDQKASKEREFTQQIEQRESALAAREAHVAELESELQALRQQVESIPSQVADAETAARAQAAEAAREQARRDHEMATMEQQWEVKLLKERAQTLEQELKARDQKLKELKTDLDAALAKAHELAEKALDRSSTTVPHRSLPPMQE